jgi:hypothetical protein
MFYFILYILGAITTYLLCQYYDWKRRFNLTGGYLDEPPVAIFVLFWFISLPMVFVGICGERVAKLGQRRRKRIEQQQKVRVAHEQESQKLLQEAETETETERFYRELNNRNIEGPR